MLEADRRVTWEVLAIPPTDIKRTQAKAFRRAVGMHIIGTLLGWEVTVAGFTQAEHNVCGALV
jgi:hypothetical protein